MGFLLTEEQVKAEQSRRAPRGPLKKKIAGAPKLDPNAVGCDRCPLKLTWGTIVSPRMPMSGPLNAEVLVLGESPGKNEDELNKQFVGESGKILRQAIPGRHLDRLAWQNIVRCRPPENATPSLTEVHACSTYLEEDIEKRPNLRAVMGIGGVPLNYFAPGERILQVHGLKFPIRIAGRTLWYYPVIHPAFIMRRPGQDSFSHESPAAPIFRSDIKRFFEEYTRWEAPEIVPLDPSRVILPQSYKEAKALLDGMTEPMGLDIETNMLKAMQRGAKILTAAFSDYDTTVAFPVEHPEAPNEWGLRLLIETCKKRRWIAHNATFELTWLRCFGFPLDLLNFEDTQALVRLHHKRETTTDMATSSRIHLGTNVKQVMKVDAVRVLEYPLDECLRYNGLDAMACVPIFDMLIDKVAKADYKRIVDSVDTTSGMELQGLPVSLDNARRLSDTWETKQREAQEKAAGIYEAQQWTLTTGEKFNIGSAVHVGEALVKYGKLDLPKTKGGQQYSTDDQYLGPHRDSNPLVAAVLDYREAQKAKSTYIDVIVEVPEMFDDGNLHPSYTTMLTKTLRLSSTSPNIQNFPRRKNSEIRSVIAAPPGHLLVCFDYGQIEARVIAMATLDKVLVHSILTHHDIHADWRDRILKIVGEGTLMEVVMKRYFPEEDKVKDDKLLKAARDFAKNQYVFASFFGASADACAERMGLPVMRMREVSNEFWQTFKGVRTWINARRLEYKEHGTVRTLTKRVRNSILWKGNEPLNCVDYETEVLSQRGWLRGSDTRPGDVLLTMNSQTKTLEWQAATDVKQFPDAVGDVYHLSGKSFSAVTTPQHRWAYFKDNNTGRRQEVLSECTSETLPDYGHIPRILPYQGEKVAKYSNDIVELVGWVLTDAHFVKKSETQVVICQSKETYLLEIDNLMTRLGMPDRARGHGKQLTWSFSGTLGPWLRRKFPGRMLTPEFLLELTNGQLNLLYNTMIKGDGSIHNGRAYLCVGTHRKEQADAFQMLATLCGRPVTLSWRAFPAQTSLYPGMANQVGLSSAYYLRETRRKQIDTAFIRCEVRHERRGMWCPMVPNTYIVARRNGSVYITGQTPIQGTAADIAVDSMNELTQLSRIERDPYFHPRIMLHDDLSFILPDSNDLPVYVERIVEIMNKVRYGFQIVPLLVEGKCGTQWDVLEEFCAIEGKHAR